VGEAHKQSEKSGEGVPCSGARSTAVIDPAHHAGCKRPPPRGSSDEKGVLLVGAARSQVRLDAVDRYFVKLVAAPCLQIDTGEIYKNSYLGVRLASLSLQKSTGTAAQVLDGVLYDFDYGLGAFLSNGTTLCDDGWISDSRGRGTCSHHGGYAHRRGVAINYQSGALIPNPTPNNAPVIPYDVITFPLTILWGAIFTHLFHQPSMPLSLLGYLIFLLVASWPLVIFATFANRLMIKDKATAAQKASELSTAGFIYGERHQATNITKLRNVPPKVVRKRSNKPRTAKPVSPLDNYRLVAWLNADEVAACVRARVHEADEQVHLADGTTAAWIRVRKVRDADGNDFEFGVERHRATGTAIIGWLSALEVGLVSEALEEDRDCQSAEITSPPATKVTYVGPHSPEGIAGQPSVRLYRLRDGASSSLYS
jgi:hypothetical protein